MFLLNHIVTGMDVDPGVPAFIEPDGSAISYPILGERIRRLAGGLTQLCGDTGAIGMLALNSRRYLELMLAAAWAGKVAVPLNVRWSPRELAFGIADAGIGLLLVDDATIPLVAGLRELAGTMPRLVWHGEGECPAGMEPFEALLEGAPSDAAPATEASMAAIVYTGGTTGQSRGVVHSQGSLMASALNWVCMGGMPVGSRCLLSLPLFHVGAIGIALAQMLQRATLVMVPAFRADLVRDAVVRRGADALAAVPTMIGMLLDDPDFDAGDYRGLCAVAYGASPMPTALLHRVMESFPNAKLTQAYGMTEVGLAVGLADRWHRADPALLAAAGQPGPLYAVRIVDDHGRDVARGAMGEVIFSGPGVMTRYLNQSELTAEALKDGWLHSGDLGAMDAAGMITLLDRKKDMIVSGGENVYSVEVENAVSSHPAVRQCAVVGVPDDRLGERVHAIVVLHEEEQQLDLDALRRHCDPLLAGYKHPRSLEIATELPFSSMGKILKSELRAKHWTNGLRKIN